MFPVKYSPAPAAITTPPSGSTVSGPAACTSRPVSVVTRPPSPNVVSAEPSSLRRGDADRHALTVGVGLTLEGDVGLSVGRRRDVPRPEEPCREVELGRALVAEGAVACAVGREARHPAARVRRRLDTTPGQKHRVARAGDGLARGLKAVVERPAFRAVLGIELAASGEPGQGRVGLTGRHRRALRRDLPDAGGDELPIRLGHQPPGQRRAAATGASGHLTALAVGGVDGTGTRCVGCGRGRAGERSRGRGHERAPHRSSAVLVLPPSIQVMLFESDPSFSDCVSSVLARTSVSSPASSRSAWIRWTS